MQMGREPGLTRQLTRRFFAAARRVGYCHCLNGLWKNLDEDQ